VWVEVDDLRWSSVEYAYGGFVFHSVLKIGAVNNPDLGGVKMPMQVLVRLAARWIGSRQAAAVNSEGRVIVYKVGLRIWLPESCRLWLVLSRLAAQHLHLAGNDFS
jgi:hypothetical protein